MDELIKQAESLGIKVFKSWDEERLKAEIAKVVEANAASSGDHAVTIEPVTITADGDPDQIAKVIAESIASAIAPAPAEEPEPEAEAEDRTVTIRNLKANPMRALGLDSYGSATFTESQFASDAVLEKRVLRGVELGLLKVETVE